MAEHLVAGPPAAMPRPIGWLTRAAREAAASSPVGAVELLERAVALMDARDPSRDELLAERAGSLLLAGRIDDAEAACRALLDRDHEQFSGWPGPGVPRSCAAGGRAAA